MRSPDQGRDDEGQFTAKMTEQDILTVFDVADDPMLTAGEVRDALDAEFGIDVTKEAVRQRLRQMEEAGLVRSKTFGARAVGWAALVAPPLADEVADRSDERQETPREEFVSLDET